MDNIAQRINNLSPKQRALLEQRVKEKGGNLSTLHGIGRRPHLEEYPLSFAQERLWFLDQLTPEQHAYNEAFAVTLSGELDIKALEASVNVVVERHEILRARFSNVDGKPRQTIAPVQPIPLHCMHLEAPTNEARREQLYEQLRSEARRPFNLEFDSLFRMSLYQFTPHEHVLLIIFHHIISDGWSTGIFIREVISGYTAITHQMPAQLPPLSVQYTDYAYWQRNGSQSEVQDQQINFWREQLAGIPDHLELPADYPRSSSQIQQGRRRTFTLSTQMSAQLRELSLKEDATLFMTLLTAFQILLMCWSGQKDIVVGTRVAGRTQTQMENLIGLFVNPIVIRTQLSNDLTFSAALQRVREVTLDAYAHQDVPFEKLVEALHPRREAGRTPLFQTMFVLQNAPMPRMELPGLTIRPLDFPMDAAKYDLDLSFSENDKQLIGKLEYASTLFNEETIERLIARFLVLLSNILAHPQTRIIDLALLGEDEQNMLEHTWCIERTGEIPSTALHELFTTQLARTPGALAVRDMQQSLDYASLERHANQLAHRLQRLGVAPEVRVAVCLQRSTRTLITLLAILKVGGVYVPLDRAYPREHLTHILAETEAQIIITETCFKEELPIQTIPYLQLDTEADSLAQESCDAPEAVVQVTNLACIAYTSGSTGLPKGIAIPQLQLLNRFAWMWRTFPFRPGEVLCQRTTASFSVSLWELLGGVLQGAVTCIFSDEITRDLHKLVAALKTYAVNRIVLVPSLLRTLLSADIDLSTLQLTQCYVCGEPLGVDLVQQFHELLPHVRLINLYGASEVNDIAFFDTHDLTEGITAPIGRPIDNLDVYILDKRLQPVPVGAEGNLYVGGPSLARGYWKQPARTAERFIPHPFSRQPGARLYATGDLARYGFDGTLYHLGREDQRIKLRGISVELGAIAIALQRHPAVRQAIVIVQNARNKPQDQRLVAYIVPRDIPPSRGSLRSFLSQQLPPYALPSAFVILQTFPLTPNGKIDRAALPAPIEGDGERKPSIAAPTTETEQAIARIWQEVLDTAPPGVHDNFFDLGGHSLLLLEAQDKLQAHFHCEIGAMELFEHPTIHDLAHYIDHQDRGEEELIHLQQETRLRREGRQHRREVQQQNRGGQYE